MPAGLLTLIVQLVAMAIQNAPEIIADIEKVLAAAKGQAPADPSWTPLAPQVDQSMAADEASLQQPIPAKK